MYNEPKGTQYEYEIEHEHGDLLTSEPKDLNGKWILYKSNTNTHHVFKVSMFSVIAVFCMNHACFCIVLLLAHCLLHIGKGH